MQSFALGVPTEFTPLVRDKRRKYSKPRILKEGVKKYWLTYSGCDSKTGPFTSAKKAMEFYNKGGR